MQGVTLLVAIMGSAAALLLQPSYALAGYFATLLWFPDYLRVSIGSVDLSAGRIVATLLILRCLTNTNIRKKFVWSTLDSWVALTLGAITVIYCVASGLSFDAIENRGGLVTDTWFAYIAARLIITDKETLVRFIKAVAIILVPLAIYGVIESTTGWQPFFQLVKYRQWRAAEANAYLATETRWGFTRAIGPFSHPILFGNCFVMFLPLVWALRRQRGNWGKMAWLLAAIVAIGAVSSVSSGPWGTMFVVIFCLVMEKYKRWTKYIIFSLIGMALFTVIASNRPLYHVALYYVNLGRGDWYQRARLIDAAKDNFFQWWLTGYGGRDPGWGSTDGGYFFGHFTDMNNQFLLYGTEGGMLALIGLCGVFAVAFRGFYRAYKRTNDIQLRSLYWSMGCTLVGLIVCWQAVSFFGQVVALFYALLGVMGSAILFKPSTRYVQKYRRIRNHTYVQAYGPGELSVNR